MPPSSQDRPAVLHNAEAARFELQAGGHMGVLYYDRVGEVLRLVHTEVPPELGGRGYANDLARAALEYAAGEGLRVMPQCPFAQVYLKRHPEYLPLVDEHGRKRLS
jgi:predicted GNAT family acetyltransferase